MRYLLLSIACLVLLVSGNVEKTIFIAPPSTPVPQDASIDNLLLLSLNSNNLSVRTFLNASFPSVTEPKGTQSWALLEGLNPGQRYELRVCWLATQPTAFWIYTHTLQEAFENPTLISSLSQYSYAQHDQLSREEINSLQSRRLSIKRSSENSLLFVQIYAAADYFTVNQTLMDNVPPVHVDLILDPYLLNVFPQSLRWTAIYIVLVAIGAWFLSVQASAWLTSLSSKNSVDQVKKVK